MSIQSQIDAKGGELRRLYLIIGKQEHDMQKARKLELLLAGFMIALPIASLTGCHLAHLYRQVPADGCSLFRLESSCQDTAFAAGQIRQS